MKDNRLEVTEETGRWVLPVNGQNVTRFCADYAAVSLLLRNGLQISIEGVFKYTDQVGERWFDPGGDAIDLAPIIQLVRHPVSGGFAHKDGDLEISFAASNLLVPASQEFEAWNITGPGGPNGLKIVSIPGGELALWLDQRSPS